MGSAVGNGQFEVYVMIDRDRLAARRTGEMEIELIEPAGRDYAPDWIGYHEVCGIFSSACCYSVDPIVAGQQVIPVREFFGIDSHWWFKHAKMEEH